MMNKAHIYEIRVEGVLSENWSDWFEGLTVEPTPDEATTLRGMLADQAAMLGVLARIHALHLTITTLKKLT
jgi:hypothetical protein